MFFYVNDVQRVVRVEILQVRENVHFDETLLLETFLVANDLQGDHFLLLVIVATQNETERAFAQRLEDFKAITNVIFADFNERSILVVVIFDAARRDLFGLESEKIDFGVIEYFCLLVFGQFVGEVSQRF